MNTPARFKKTGDNPLFWAVVFAAAMFVFGWYGIVRKLYELDKFALLFAVNAGGLVFFLFRWTLKNRPGVERKAMPFVLCLAVVALANDLLMFWAYDYTLATTVPLVRQCFSVFVLFLAPFITGERANRQEAWSVPISIIGVVFLYGGGFHTINKTETIGMVLALISGLAYAFTVLLYRKLGLAKVPVESVNVWRFSLGTAVLLFVPQVRAIPSLPSTQLYAFAGSVVGFGLLGNILHNYSVGRVRSFAAALINKTVALWGAVFAYLLLGERLTMLGIVGGVLILISSSTAALAYEKAKK